MQTNKTPGGIKVRYPIGIKLVTIITILLLVSLGAITALVSVMVSGDVRITAEENNFTVNRRSAAEAEIILAMIRSNALVLLDTLNATASGTGDSVAVNFFFERNRDTAAIAIAGGGGESAGIPGGVPAAAPRAASRLLINEGFFLSSESDSSLVPAFLESSGEALGRCTRGDTVLLNAAPVFGFPLLALFYPWREGGGAGAAVILFSPEALTETFGTGVNQSFLINDDGDVLVHADSGLTLAGANLGDLPFIRSLWESREQNLQTLYSGEDGTRYFGAFRKLSFGNAAVVTSVEYNLVFEGIAATTRRNILLTGAVLFISILFIWFFSKSISGPLKKLTEAAGRIQEGEFEVQLTARGGDEIGALTTSFGMMSAALGIFGRFTNREIAVRAMKGEIKPGGQLKHATIFFSDIRGFTEKSENFTKKFGKEASNRIVQWLNEYFTRMVECVEKTGGVVDKFIGDAVMAHWGTAYSSGSPEGDALNCVKASLGMRKALWEMNKDRNKDDPANPPIRIGCGINTGEVTAGQIGSEKRMEYTVVGDAVNLANRTEALNKPLGTDILITENTWNLIGKYLITEEMPLVSIKGKEEPVRMFAVVNLKAKEGEPQPKPAALAEVRRLLGIEAPDLSKVNAGAEEEKYKIRKITEPEG
ncbi:MAG: HAMP domain-containing protein [Treponema sp.]|jgi:adenylate cyclase|nr:HAMP domain-containing protein [Treponema sp.]